MPLHEYKCRSCGNAFEALIRGAEQPECPSCHSKDLEKQLSLFAVDSAATRQSNLDAGKRHIQKEHRDRRVAEREAVEHHHH